MSDRIIVFGGNGVYPPVRNLDEEERQEEAERAEAIKQIAREVAAAVHEEKVNVALGELEAEITKVVHAELAEKPRKTPAKTLARHKKHLAAFRSWCESVSAAAQSIGGGDCCWIPGKHGDQRRYPKRS